MHNNIKAEWILKFLLMNGIGLKILSIKKKFDRTGRGTCFKFGENFGERCYTFGFITP